MPSSFNERDVLTHSCKVKAAIAEALTFERFERFDAKRRAAEMLAADKIDIEALEKIDRTSVPKK